MAHSPNQVQALGLRAWELSGRLGRRGLREQRDRVKRWRERLWLILQCSLTAALAWFICERVLGHQMPFFGPVAAVICLGLSFGQRLTRALEVSAGVAVGVLVGHVFVLVFGAGVWQIALVCFVAMSIATWLGARNLMIIQSGLQAITVLLLLPQASQGWHRWIDAVVGCSLALVVTTLAPSSSVVVRPRILTAQALTHVAGTLRATRVALVDDDEDAAFEVLRSARAATTQLKALQSAADEGMAVVRYSPFLRRHRVQQQALSELIDPLDKLIRDLRVMGRRTVTVTWRGERVPTQLQQLLDDLADALDFCAGELYERRLPTAAIPRLLAIGERTAEVDPGDDLSAIVILGQLRFMVVDVLELCGIPYRQARKAIPRIEDV